VTHPMEIIRGRHVWICGSGPTLDYAGPGCDWCPSGGAVVFGVNMACYSVQNWPGIHFAIAADTLAIKYMEDPIPAPFICGRSAAPYYRGKYHADPCHVLTKEEHLPPGTCMSAAGFAVSYGARCVSLVGVDGGLFRDRARAKCSEKVYQWQNNQRISLNVSHFYGKIRETVETYLSRNSVPWRNLARELSG